MLLYKFLNKSGESPSKLYRLLLFPPSTLSRTTRNPPSSPHRRGVIISDFGKFSPFSFLRCRRRKREGGGKGQKSLEGGSSSAQLWRGRKAPNDRSGPSSAQFPEIDVSKKLFFYITSVFFASLKNMVTTKNQKNEKVFYETLP